jgi:leucyl-tRNA synthetase
MGPYAETGSYPFDLGGIAGIRRFLERVNGLREHVTTDEPKETLTLLHKTIKKVRGDISEYKFNTAISALMIFINHAEKSGLSPASYQTYLVLLAPFAPHLTEELWQEAGESDSIHTVTYPTFDDALTIDDVITIGVQINGKVRGSVTIAPDAPEQVALDNAYLDATLANRLNGKTIAKVIYVPGRILNLIVPE